MNTRHLLSSKGIIFVLILLALVLAQMGLAGAGRAWAQEPATPTPTPEIPTEPPTTDQPVAATEEAPALPATASTTHCGAINLNATWSVGGNVHEVTCDVTIAAGVTLTIDAGTIVKFHPNTSLIVNGKLTVSGTTLDPVYFTAFRDDTIGGDTNGDGASVGARGDWDRIQFNSTSDVTSLIDHAVIRFGGDGPGGWGGVSLSDASPTIQNSEITQNSYCAITANLGSFPTLAGNNLHDNDANGLCLSGGNLTVTPATWNVTDTSYFLRGNVTIPLGHSLTVAPGVVVKFDLGTSLIVDDKLTVSGTSGSPVYFTSLRDDTIGGDTNGDPSVGARGDWDRIQFNSTSDDTSLIDHAVIRFGGDNTHPWGGVTIGDANPTIQNSEITQNSYCAITANLGSFPTLTGNNLHANDANGLCLSGGDLPVTPATWNVTDTSYFLRGNVTIPTDRSLTVAPGVVVKFDFGTSLIVNGKLTVPGTSGSPVYFTSLKDDTIGGDTNGDGASSGVRGDWDRIQFNSTSDDTSLIDHAVIRFGGDNTNPWGGVSLGDASPTIQNSEITQNSYCAITANLGSFPTLTSNNLHANDANGLCLSGGDLPVTPATWNVTSTSYFLRGNVTIPVGRSLTVAAGVVVKFDLGTSLIVDDKLMVSGTALAPVYFTSLRDDTIGGDTNGDGSSSGGRGDWDRIQFNNSSDDTSVIDHAVIRFGGDNTNAWGGVTIGDANPTIQNTTLTQNAFAGLFVKNALPTLVCDNIYSNQSYGLNNKVPGPTVSAENLWWGTETGPYHATNPSGTGNAVTDSVDFIPWTTQPCGFPAAFSKIGPDDNSRNQPVSVTLSWQSSAGEDSYQYCFDTSNNGTCNTSWVSTGHNTSAQLSNLSLGTTYHWQVRASNALGITYANDAAWWSFTTLPTTTNFRSAGTYDGWVLESGETTNVGGTMNATATTLQVGDNNQDRQYRSILAFSTAGLPDNAVITSAQIKVCSAGVVGANPFTTHQGLRVDIRNPYFGTTVSLQTSDFQATASAGSVGTFGTTPSGGCYTVTLNATGRQWVNRVGTTQFRLRFMRDDNDDLGNDYIKFYSGNSGQTALRPTLIIKYYVP